MSYKTILFDFHGVLCRDYLFTSLHKTYPEVEEYVQTEIFGKGSEMGDRWMRGEMDVEEVMRYVGERNGIDQAALFELLIESIGNMRIDRRMTDLAQELARSGRKVALVTDNMDIFDCETIGRHRLDEIFPVIVNSCDYGVMKCEQEGKLFDIALSRLGAGSYEGALLIDDSVRIRPVFESLGGSVYTYETFEKFEPWMRDNLLKGQLGEEDRGRAL